MTTPSSLVITEPSLRLFRSYLEKDFTKDELSDLANQFRAKALKETNTFYACVSEGLFLFPRLIELSRYDEILKFLLQSKEYNPPSLP